MDIVTLDEARTRGLIRYFTGKPCPHGHVAERNVKTRCCIECLNIKQRAYQRRRRLEPEYREAKKAQHRTWEKANPEKTKAANRRYYLAHSGRQAEYSKAWRAANAARARETARRWRAANRHRQREYDRRKRERDPEGRAALLKRLETNPAYEKAGRVNKQARKRASNGRVSAAELAAVRARAKGRCANCGQKRTLEYDHITPLSKGGRHEAKNLQMLCRPCNNEKNARDPIKWAQDNGRLL